MRRYSHLFSLCLAATALYAATKTTTQIPKSFAEKEEIAIEMKKISKQLDVRCEYCHTEADRGLREGDYTLLTREGEYAHAEMFPLSEKFKVDCSFCHDGNDLTAAGERAHRDMKFIKKYLREQKKKLACTSCHIPGIPGREFSRFTKLSDRLRSR